jgi:hypothetical protein
MTNNHSLFVKLIRERRATGASLDDALREIRTSGATFTDSVKALREAEGIPLAKAKILVDESSTWADARESNEWLRDAAEDAAHDD